MKWTKPQFEEITLALEVKGYVSTDDARPASAALDKKIDSKAS